MESENVQKRKFACCTIKIFSGTQSYHHLHGSLFLGLIELDMRYTDLSSIPPDLLAAVISRMEVLKEDIGPVVSIIPTK